jgi:hypothetical protein
MTGKYECRQLAHDAGLSQTDWDIQERALERRKEWKRNAKVLRDNGYKYNPGYKSYILNNPDGSIKHAIGIPVTKDDIKRFTKTQPH